MRTPRNIFALRVHHLRTNNVNVYVSKIYPSGLTLEGAYIGGRGGGGEGYIQDVTCVTYLGGILTRFYGISRGACLWKVSDHWWYPPTLNLHAVKSGSHRYCGSAVIRYFLCCETSLSNKYMTWWVRSFLPRSLTCYVWWLYLV